MVHTVGFAEVTTLGGRVRGTLLSMVVGTFLPTTLAIFLVSFFTDQWSRADLRSDVGKAVYLTGGLWRRCKNIGTGTLCRHIVGTDELSVATKTAQGLFIMAIACSGLALIVCTLYLLVKRFQRDQRVAILISALLYVSAALSALGCASYYTGDLADRSAEAQGRQNLLVYQLMWGFGLAIVYVLMMASLGVFMSVEVLMSRNMIPA